MKASIAAFVLTLSGRRTQGANSRCASHHVPQDSRCSGCPPMLNGKLCASTTRYNDQTKAACGCGPSEPVPTDWWTLTKFTAALNTASLDPQNPLLGWCPTGCGACYEICSTGGTTQGQPTTPGICRTFKITNRCADGYGQYPEWCSNSMSWQECQANPSACAQEGSTNKFGYSAHFDLQDFHGQIHNFSWDNVEVTFEPVSCSQWDGPQWDCECASDGSKKKCEFWCSQDSVNPWSTKCTWNGCRGCSQCSQQVTTSKRSQDQCAWWCNENSHLWSTKCTWNQCQTCTECFTTSREPLQQCAAWCGQNEQSWSTKCTWRNCQSCSHCAATTTLSPCASENEDCRQAKCCSDPTMQCYEKDPYWGSCRQSCEPGTINPKDPIEFQTPWSCALLSQGTATTTLAVSSCSGLVEDCRASKCCSDPGLTCFEKDQWWAECKASCPSQISWSCKILSSTTTSTKANLPDCTSNLVEDCRSTRCCSNPDLECFEKNEWWAECKASCQPGIDMTEAPEYRTPWSCVSLSATATTTKVVSHICSGVVEDCRSSRCCINPSLVCFEKNDWWAECKSSCAPGIDMTEAPEYRTPWSCVSLSDTTTSTTAAVSNVCSGANEDCRGSKCCTIPGFKCFEKDQWWAQCKASCTPGLQLNDMPQTPWSCTILQDDGASSRHLQSGSDVRKLQTGVFFSI